MSAGGVNVSTDVLTEIAVAAGDPSLTLDELGQRMNLLYQLAEQKEDAESVALVTTVWDGVVKLSEQAGQAINIATAAREIAVTLRGQRDVAIAQHEELAAAVNDYDMSCPAVSQLVNAVEENSMTSLMEGGAYITFCPACDITEEGLIPVSHTVAEVFHSVITGGYLDYGLSAEITREIADFMVLIVQKVNAEVDGE